MASLRDLGLSEYEARVYRALLRTGPTTAKELSRVSDVPMGRIYDVLNSIETRELVRSQSASRPTKYAAVEPETALDRLLEAKRAELEQQARQYEETVEELVEELEAGDPVEDSFWTAAVGPEESVDLLVERLAAADERLVLVASTLSSQFDVDRVGELVVEEIEAALDRGVDVSMLLRPALVDQLPERVGDRYRRRLQQRDRFAVRTSDAATGTFEVIDNTEVCIEVPHPLNDDGTFAMIDFKDRTFAANVRAEFEPRWEAADPLRL